MGEFRTIGETVDMAFARAEAEMRSGRRGLSMELPATGGVNVLVEMERHLVEAVDALLDAAGSFGGIDQKRKILSEAAARHGLKVE